MAIEPQGISADGIDTRSVVAFLDNLFSFIEETGIDVSEFEADHICYKPATRERYEELKGILEKLGEQISENEVNGRPVAVYRLNQPIDYNGRIISILELPHPKPDHSAPERWDHIEFVIQGTLDQLTALHPSLPWDRRGMKKQIGGIAATNTNPDASLEFNGGCVRFHLLSLEEVIRKERAMMTSAMD